MDNSSSSQVASFWTRAGDASQSLWSWLLEHTGTKSVNLAIVCTIKLIWGLGNDDYVLGVYGTFIIVSVIYWTLGSLYTYIDVTGKPAFLKKYKIQPGINAPLSPAKLGNLLVTVFINQTIVLFPLLIFGHKAHEWRGRPDTKILPEFHRVVLELIVCVLAEDMCFFYSHWLLHHKRVTLLIASMRYPYVIYNYSRFTSTSTRNTTSGQHQ